MFPDPNSNNKNLAKEDEHQRVVNSAEMENGDLDLNDNDNGTGENEASNAIENPLTPEQLFASVSLLEVAGQPTATAGFDIPIFEILNDSAGINDDFGGSSPDLETINPEYEDNVDVTEVPNAVAFVDAIPTPLYTVAAIPTPLHTVAVVETIPIPLETVVLVDAIPAPLYALYDGQFDWYDGPNYETGSSTQGVVGEDEMDMNEDLDFESGPLFGNDDYDPEFGSFDRDEDGEEVIFDNQAYRFG